ncbi:phosphatidylinositol kinase [Pseudomonas monteilii]|uniref:Phosphatidylinositol kinase n=1 Tax=Pseudomonas monteilii TaxID=76759 RepID=A0AAP7FKT9_9PSED|nr:MULTISPECIES: type II toxin-antitoxin system HipA family toxin [Pseudomonas]KPM60526.1 phosphatidylinositol kinase [Pseudomonas putida]AYN15621.1 phosphatidylinositol kinase [Pseudomonas monteilii]AYO00720.1 type II toxin-antitoxin system HipA family toxin [Pseudomonas sp. LTGT-11-2Z]MBA1318413.1 type II toxin-antitoxin system HipA family toxin [Pseudomonas monteilii]MBA6090431.1 type II toxin-antitoxin system HipA family toxin [Pseudomonas monteilii]
MTSQRDRLYIGASGEAVGTLGRSEDNLRDSVFVYNAAVTEEQAVSLTMPVRLESYKWEYGIHPLFEMHIPEGHLKEELMRRFSKSVRGFDDFALLGIVGPHQLGRISIAQHASDQPLPGIKLANLLIHDGATDLFNDLLSTYATYSGVSGVQPKVLVRDTDEVGAEVGRFTHRGATHLVKAFNEAEFPQLAANEFFCMRAALHCGLEVPEFQLSQHGQFLVVRRFDIGSDSYLGFEDMCVLSGWGTRKKYDGSYQGCAQLIKLYVTPGRVPDALESFFTLVALCAGIQNGDAHLKNFGLLYENCAEDADIRLAPAYDLVTTTVYNSHDIMGLLLGGSKAWPKRKMLVQFGRTACNLTQSRCDELLNKVEVGINRAMAELSDYRNSHPAFERIGEKMAAAWAQGMNRSIVA